LDAGHDVRLCGSHVPVERRAEFSSTRISNPRDRGNRFDLYLMRRWIISAPSGPKVSGCGVRRRLALLPRKPRRESLVRFGPDWVAQAVNGVGGSQYWKNTATFVVWDDWGGFYDHVTPQQSSNYELGFRVPLIAISRIRQPAEIYRKKTSVPHRSVTRIGRPTTSPICSITHKH